MSDAGKELFDHVGKGRKPSAEETQRKLLEKMDSLSKGPRKWKFTVNRDDDGRIRDVVAEAQD